MAFDKKMKPLVEEFFYGNDIAYETDGRVIVHASMPEDGWVYGMILSYGAFVEVISPERIRRLIADTAEQIVKKYRANST